MANKADYIALINTKLPDGANIPSSDHRDTMHTNANSIAEVVYGAKVGDDNSTQAHTTSNANFNYQIDIFKNGNTITIYGQIASLVDVGNNQLSKIFDFSDTDLYGNGIGFGRGVINNTSNIKVRVVNTALYVDSAVLNGGIYDFSITYNSTN